MRPPNDAEVTLACKTLMIHAEASGIPKPDPASLKTVWAMHCRDMPVTLLQTGLARVLKGWKNTFCLPAPGAVWDEIEKDLARMRSDLAALEKAHRMTSEESYFDVSDRAPSAETDKVIQDTLAMLKTHSNKKGRIF